MDTAGSRQYKTRAPKMTDKQTEQDLKWMQQAYALAEIAALAGEVPVGALLVKDDKLIASAHNAPIGQSDPTAHAEILVLREAAKKLQNYRLVDTTLYVTLEPCAMCAGAMVHARIKRLVYGADDPRTGAAKSVFDIVNNQQLNHRIACTSGVMADEASHLLKTFFESRRRQR